MNELLLTAEGRVVWPFPSFNGQQTEASKALMALRAGQSDKGQHRPIPINLNDIEDASW